jgi:hypothetical protein
MWDGDQSTIPDTTILCWYGSPDTANGRGLVLGMDTNAVTYIEDACNTPGYCIDEFKRTVFVWVLLQETLQMWWNRIESGKFIPARDEAAQPPASITSPGW